MITSKITEILRPEFEWEYSPVAHHYGQWLKYNSEGVELSRDPRAP